MEICTPAQLRQLIANEVIARKRGDCSVLWFISGVDDIAAIAIRATTHVVCDESWTPEQQYYEDNPQPRDKRDTIAKVSNDNRNEDH